MYEFKPSVWIYSVYIGKNIKSFIQIKWTYNIRYTTAGWLFAHIYNMYAQYIKFSSFGWVYITNISYTSKCFRLILK